jgi:Prophage tail length tape measure protein
MSEVYGFSVEISGNAVKSITAIDSSLHKLETDVKSSTSNIEGHFREMGGTIKTLIGAGTGLGFLFGGVSLAKASLEAFDKRQESLAKLGAVLQSTGNVAGETAENLEKLAGVQSKGQLFSKSSIEDAQSMLLTFTQIRGKIFEEAMPAIGDFATRFKMELPAAAMMVGKALNNPLTGMTRLQRQGVMFSEQQKEQIRNFVAVGDTASAQGVILGELQKEFGGLAEAMTKTDAGKLQQATKALTEMKLGIGKLLTEGLAKLEPVITGIGNLFHKVFGTQLSKDMEESRITMDSMFESLKDSNLPLDEKKKIIAELNTQYPEYVKTVVTDKMTTEELGRVEMESNQAMLDAIKIQVGKELMQEFINKAKDVEKKYAEASIQLGRAENTPGLVRGITGVSGKMTPMPQERAITIAKQYQEYMLTKVNEADDELKRQLGLMPGSYKGGADIKGKGLDAITKSVDEWFEKQFGKKPGGAGGGGGAFGADATNTSLLGGASGGLGEAKTVKIDFHKALMEINVPGGNGQDIINKAPMTMEVLLRILNNLALSQGSTM